MDPHHPETRISDAERERVVARLNDAVSEGRLTLAEFEERIDGVLRSRTYGEVEPYTADLPAPLSGPAAPAREVTRIRARASGHKRTGRWIVPRRLVIEGKAASIKLDFVTAVYTHPVVEIEVDATASSLLLVLPPGASAEVDELESHASSVKSRVPADGDAPGIRFVVGGLLRSSSIKVRYQRRFWRWRW